MKWLKLISISIMLLAFSSCFSSASKMQSIVDKEVGKAQLLEKTRLELDKYLGKKDSKFKSSVMDYVSDHIKIDYNTIVDGRMARVDVVAVMPKMDEIGTLLLLASFLPKEKVLNMTMADVMAEVSKSTRKPASVDDIKTETYEFSVNFEKEKDWQVNTEQLKKAYTKKNLITKR
jgi:hypothetical protein